MPTLLEKIKNSVVKGVTVAAEKTEDYTKLGKAKIDVLAVKRSISKQFTELGGIVYEAVKDKKVDEAMKEKKTKDIIAALKKLEKELGDKEKTFLELKKKVMPEDTTECGE